MQAKAGDLPIDQLLGGRRRDGAMVYAHANGRDLAETADRVGEYLEKGYKAVRAQSGMPGIEGVYGIGRNGNYEPATKGLPQESVWSTEAYLDFVPDRFEALRDRYGMAPHLLHDVHHRLTPIEAARLGKSLEPYRLFWMEAPTPAANQETFRLIRQHTVTPLAVGAVFNTNVD